MTWPVNARYQTLSQGDIVTHDLLNAEQDAIIGVVGGSKSVKALTVDAVGDQSATGEGITVSRTVSTWTLAETFVDAGTTAKARIYIGPNGFQCRTYNAVWTEGSPGHWAADDTAKASTAEYVVTSSGSYGRAVYTRGAGAGTWDDFGGTPGWVLEFAAQGSGVTVGANGLTVLGTGITVSAGGVLASAGALKADGDPANAGEGKCYAHHFMGDLGNAPVASNPGTNCTNTVDPASTNARGAIGIVSSGTSARSRLATITFDKPYPAAPFIAISTDTSATTGGMFNAGIEVQAVTTDGFDIYANSALANPTSLTVTWIVMG